MYDNDDDKKDDSVKVTLVGLAVSAGLFALASVINETLDRRARIKANLEHAKGDKSLDALAERQKKFERDLIDFQEKQHQHFEQKVAHIADATATALEALAKRLDQHVTPPSGEKPGESMPKYPFGDQNN